jgi:hypothetical protein
MSVSLPMFFSINSRPLHPAICSFY